MTNYLLWLTLGIAVADWVAVARNYRRLEYVLKPAVMLVLIAWLGINGGFSGSLLWFAIGLVFSLVGDICLMLPREQFIAGLVAFLLAHIAYLIGFNNTFPPINLPSLVLLIIVAFTAAQIFRRISAGLTASNNTNLRFPILAYTIIISLMLFSALVTLVRLEWQSGAALLVSLGALLFFLSDTFLAWNKFVSPLRYHRVPGMVCYHIGQILITLGAASHFLAIG